METHILVVEDDAEIREGVAIYLKNQGYTVHGAANGAQGLELARQLPIHLAVVDVMMPVMDGITMVMKLRDEGCEFPVIMLSAKSEDIDKITGLNIGADDYVTKPFHIEEVAARMQALLRRNSGLASQVISLPPFQVDLSRRELSVNDQPIKLTAFEYTIMETLIRNRGKVVSKDSLMLQLYPDAELRESHTIDVLMGRLRKKIQAEYPQDVITTVRGQGYLFELR